MSNTIEIIRERIGLADSILTKVSTLSRIPRPRSNSGVISIDYKVRYDTTLVNQIKDELAKWQFVTKEILIKLFGEDSRFTKRFEDSIVEHKIGRDYKAELTRETEEGVTALNSIIESIQISGVPSRKEPLEKSQKSPMVFISHSSKDKVFVEA